MRFQNPGLAGGFDLLLGLYFFCFQIYCDFSGYSDIARGVSRFFGVKLMTNFNQPYFSSTITEFWRRWHISLSSWLRDYLYITLGGNRGGQFNTYRNLMLTMLLGGRWHGASWTFVVWGGLHGLYLAIHKLWIEKTGGPPVAEPFWRTLLKMLATFHLVALTWIFFRAPDFSTAWLYVSRLVMWAPAQVKLFSWSDRFALISILVLFLFDWLQVRGKEHVAILRYSWLPRAFLYALLFIVIFALGGLESKVPFIYFQF
jgi:D-alanyl-lipoteichoic acid acyltransferase DltB (MBOAT superfamily)